MKFFLIDDDANVRNILKILIRDRKLGEICGSCSNAKEALEDLPASQADLVIVDLLMPEMDGITFVKNAKAQNSNLIFIMLSQVSSKDMISSAYESGIEFYIQKPINSIEVEAVLRRTAQHLDMKRRMAQVQSLFADAISPQPAASAASKEPSMGKIQNALQKLGISGEIGSRDILMITKYMIQHQNPEEETTLSDICGHFHENPKSVEQRIRRAALAGLVNLAHLGLEDYSNEIFAEFSTTLYNFQQVRREMDYIRKKADKHGNVKVKNFLNALLLYSQN